MYSESKTMTHRQLRAPLAHEVIAQALYRITWVARRHQKVQYSALRRQGGALQELQGAQLPLSQRQFCSRSKMSGMLWSALKCFAQGFASKF